MGKKSILYIEDNQDNAEIVEKILEKEGYIFYLACDGKKGVEMVKEHQPDLIICDYHLPEMNGPETIKAIRAIEGLEATPVIILTADLYNRTSSLSAGANRYLNKPIRRNQLIRAISQLLPLNDTDTQADKE